MKNIFGLFFISLFILSCNSKVDMGRDNYDKLVKHELDFASLSESRGRRTAFMKNLHDSSIVFTPAPQNGKKIYEKVADIPGQLLWFPKYAYISSAGDLGFTTGPWKYSNDSARTYSYYGHYLSIWQNDGSEWKILFDGGISYGDKYPWTDSTKWFTDKIKKNNEEINMSDSPKNVINKFFDDRETFGDKETFDKYGDNDLKIYRSPKFPFFYRDCDNDMFNSEQVIGFKNILTKTSASDDFFYSLDEVVKKETSDNVIKKNTSLTIWIRRNTEWKLLICLESFVE